MVNLISMFLELEPDDKVKCVELFNGILFPIKTYVIMVVILLFLILCTNIYIITKQ